MHRKQSTSLRVDQTLYDRLADLAHTRGTSITRQLEQAIRQHVEGALVEDHAQIIHPALRQVITDNLEACVTDRIDQMKERLAGLLAKQALDTACLYLLNTHRLDEAQLAQLRKAAAKHVRGKLLELDDVTMVHEEIATLKAEINRLTEANRLVEERCHSAVGAQQHAERQAQEWQTISIWRERLINWLAVEWDRQGLMGRRKPLQQVLLDFERENPRPKGA